ncbi:hypothetical protein [Mesorhizobium sp. M0323]|uniref:hypothetical protein n=2 Tax=unclassified Mesorhizobium TaxID=325217 RepID=UPI00333C8B3C
MAMLALAPNGTRSRKWLQSKLWSTRGEEQGAASLRQELSEVRKSLRRAGIDLISTDRDVVRLDVASIGIDLNDPPEGSATRDLLEGLDIRDPEFEDWLREQRSQWPRPRTVPANVFPVAAADQLSGQRSASLLNSSRLCLGLVRDARWTEGSANRAVSDLVLDLVVRSILNFEVVDVVDFQAQGPLTQAPDTALPDWLLQTRATVVGDRVGLTFALIAPGDSRLLWSHTDFLEPADLTGPASLKLMSLVNQIVFSILEFVLDPKSIRDEPRHRASRLALTALRQVFRMRDTDLDSAERMLAEAYELDPRSTYLAWQLFVFVTRFGERRVGRSGTFHDQVRECASRAVEVAPFNPITLALAAHAHSFVFREYAQALELADRAIAANPLQAICWDMRALTLGYLGEVKRGYEDAMRARALGGPPLYRYCIDTTCCILATLNGRFEEGIRHGERVLAQQPTYLPALRYSAACHGHLGHTVEAVRTIERLRAWEPDFSLELLSEENYPIAGVLGVSVIKSGLSRITLPRYAP